MGLVASNLTKEGEENREKKGLDWGGSGRFPYTKKGGGTLFVGKQNGSVWSFRGSSLHERERR